MSLAQMISRCFGVADLGQYGLNWLKNNFLGEVLEERDLIIDLFREAYPKNPFKETITEEELDSYRSVHPYMKVRKLTDKVIDYFDVGYDNKTECLTFPIRDINGNCLFVARRSVNYKYFNYPSKVEKPLYGIYELNKLKKFPDEIYICESIINCLTIWGWGGFAVALNGTGTPYQYKQLKNLPCRKYILALDPDEAGEKGCKRLKKALTNKIITKLKIPIGKDVNDLTEDEFYNLEEIFV